MTAEFDQEVEAKINAAGMSLTDVLMFAYASGRHLDTDFCDLFECLLERKLTTREKSELGGVEELQHFNFESFIGTPLEAEASA